MRVLVTVFAVSALSASAFGDLKVMATEDVVILLSGEEIRGTVLAVGMKAVVMIVNEAERIIPRGEVASVGRGEVRPNVKGYQTEAVDGVKVVVGEGFRDSEPASGEAEAAAKPKKGAKAGRGKVASGKKRKPAIPKGKVDELMKDPKVRDVVNRLGGRDKVMGMLEKNRNDPRVKSFMQQFLKTGRLPPGLDKLFK